MNKNKMDIQKTEGNRESPSQSKSNQGKNTPLSKGRLKR